MTRLLPALFFLLSLYTAAPLRAEGEPLLKNGDFKEGTEGWAPVWAREPTAVSSTLEPTGGHGGAAALRIEHQGEHDWSLSNSVKLDVQPGEIYEYTAWVRVQGEGCAILSVISRDAAGEVVNWSFGSTSTWATSDWVQLRSRFVIPRNVTTIVPRFIGDRPATIWGGEFVLQRVGNIADLRAKDLPAEVTIHNATAEATLHTANSSFSVKDLRTGKTWEQRPVQSQLVVLEARPAGHEIELKLIDPVTLLRITARAALEEATPELVVSVNAAGPLDQALIWPAPFASAKGQQLIVPLNEGISYPVDDPSLHSMHLILYGGHGICMPWYGAMDQDGQAGWMAIVETPDDAELSIPYSDQLLCLSPEWIAQKGQFGPERVIRYVLLDKGGYVAMAKRYREYAKKTGLFKTLAEKRKTVPAIDQLVGAVNVWCWDKKGVDWCRELQSLGIERIQWSYALPPDQIAALNDMGVLTSRYDIYQDAMDPANFPLLQWQHPDWASDAWKNGDLMTGPTGDWIRGWEVETKDGKMIPCGTLCDRQALDYARQRISAELKTHPYHCRFIDTTTASPWRECYDPRHPMTRSESKHYKMELLKYVSQGSGLVCGSETGHDASVPYADYFEGMMSLGPYRIPDAGRDMNTIVDKVPELVAKFQTGHQYRLPLWELVYHDCVVAQWYWGDYNNKLPALWDRRDLWNALYGTAPMFMFDRKIWDANKDRFVKSYQTATPVARATGYSEMLSHEWLTPDHAVQRSRFANGVTVTVNFGDTPFVLADGKSIPPLGNLVEGIGK